MIYEIQLVLAMIYEIQQSESRPVALVHKVRISGYILQRVSYCLLNHKWAIAYIMARTSCISYIMDEGLEVVVMYLSDEGLESYRGGGVLNIWYGGGGLP
jgi:hypothetical protein